MEATSTARAAPFMLCAVRNSDCRSALGSPWPPSRARRSRLKLRTCSATSSTNVDIRLSIRAALFKPGSLRRLSPHHLREAAAGVAQGLGGAVGLLGGGEMLARRL